jgi:sarcosine oxidase subunit alpha
MCPNCLMNVDGVPNVRTCTVPVREGMVVRHQNAWPSLERDYLSVSEWAQFLMPPGWYYKMFTTSASWKRVEPYIRRVAGLGDPPALESRGEYEHASMQAAVAVVGGGPAGMEGALGRAANGQDVLLIDDQPELGGHLRYGGSDSELAPLKARVHADSRIQVLSGAYCFGL